MQWLLDCLREAHQDRLVDDEVESIPLLPLSAESTAAMDNHQFLNLIRMMGFTPPANEQVSRSVKKMLENYAELGHFIRSGKFSAVSELSL